MTLVLLLEPVFYLAEEVKPVNESIDISLMCGRYTIVATAREIERRFEVEVPSGYTPRFNAAPTQLLPVITNERQGGLSFFRWGLLPAWHQGKNLPPIINARIETLDEKATFRKVLQHRRCLIPADGYYEWKRISKKSRIPYRLCLESREMFAFAGLWEVFIDENHHQVYSFAIITTAASDELSVLHARMPVILEREFEKNWISDSFEEGAFTDFLPKYSVTRLYSYSVSSMVNSVQNDDPKLIVPAPAADQYGILSLF